MADKIEYIRLTRCQICSGQRLHDILNLGMNPSCNCVTKEEIEEGRERMWPLVICYCEDCWCVQSRYVVSPRILFGGEYQHIAGIPLTFRKDVIDLASTIVKRFRLSNKDLAIDIGSNDGSLLEQYIPRGIRVLGVDPSNAARITLEKGIPTVNDFFDEGTAWQIVGEYGRARVVTALNTFAHVAALESFMKGIQILLDEKGVFVTESHYLLDLVDKLQYDFAYHDHLRHYSLKTLSYLFSRYDMQVFDVQRIPTHGGSIRVFAARRGSRPVSERVRQLLKLEDKSKLFSASTYVKFATRARRQRSQLRRMLSEIKKSQKRLVGITYPCRGITLMQYCGIGSNYLEYITDNSPTKIGKFMPGSHVKIVDESTIFKDQPDYGLLLSWHLSDEIVPKFRAKGYRGKFVIPLPNPRIV